MTKPVNPLNDQNNSTDYAKTKLHGLKNETDPAKILEFFGGPAQLAAELKPILQTMKIIKKGPHTDMYVRRKLKKYIFTLKATKRILELMSFKTPAAPPPDRISRHSGY